MAKVEASKAEVQPKKQTAKPAEPAAKSELELAVANLRTAAIIFAILVGVLLLWVAWLNIQVSKLRMQQSYEQYPMMQRWQTDDNNWYR